MTQRTLVAGIGNIFLGDDGFGVEVARRLAERPLGDGVRVADFGIRGFDLAYALLDGYDHVILVDTVARGGAPGTLYLLEPEIEGHGGGAGAEPSLAIQGHALVPSRVLELVRSMGGSLGNVRVVGCEPATLPAGDDVRVGLSERVTAAVDAAVALVQELLESTHA
jgi:hydrogenase maturation protease